jgi:hypothetical protein
MDNTKHKFELLKMARELLNEEYINRRAQDHNKWIAECDVAWKTRGVKLPYPPFAPYPTEAEIIAKATSLYSFLSAEEPPTEAPVIPNAVSTAAEFALEISKGPPWNVQIPAIQAAVSGEPVDVVKPKVETFVVPDPTVTTVDTEIKVEPEPEVNKPAETTELEPKPLFAIPSWLQKTQK